MNQKKRVLFTKGIADDNLVTVAKVSNFNNLVYSPGGSCNVFKYLKSGIFSKTLVTLDRKNIRRIKIEDYDILFNQISDPDTHKKVLNKLASLINRSKKRIVCINHPKSIFETSRDNIYDKLHDIEKLIVPKTVKTTPKSPDDIRTSIKTSGLQYPVLFRKAGDHGGVSTILLNSEDEVEIRTYPFALDGREYYLTRFHDYGREGIFTKYRLAVIDGEVFIRHVICSNEWMVHAKSKNIKFASMEKILLNSFEEELKPKIKENIKEIYKRLSLDYFGIDCSINDKGEMCIFEINANMNILIGATANTIGYVEKIKNALTNMIESKLLNKGD